MRTLLSVLSRPLSFCSFRSFPGDTHSPFPGTERELLFRVTPTANFFPGDTHRKLPFPGIFQICTLSKRAKGCWMVDGWRSHHYNHTTQASKSKQRSTLQAAIARDTLLHTPPLRKHARTLINQLRHNKMGKAKKTKGGGKKQTAADDDDDWDAILEAEAGANAATAAAADGGAAVKAEEASAPSEPEKQEEQLSPPADAAAAGTGGAAQDAAAAFLAAQGISVDAGGAEGAKKDHKKKKKKKKGGAADAATETKKDEKVRAEARSENSICYRHGCTSASQPSCVCSS